ncbi:MAG: hypothetical protein ACKVON_11470 [Beijerinckiaceae bacterium]
MAQQSGAGKGAGGGPSQRREQGAVVAGAQPRRKDAALLIHLVHGTFAGDPSSADSKKRKWWEKDSSWSDALQVDVRNAAERLGGHVSVEIAPLQWPEPGIGPGQNLETERRRGGEAILKTLEENEKAGQNYHIVAHSHGGSAVWHALIAAAAQKKNLPHLRSWTTVGTPFLTFQPAMSEILRPALTLVVLLAMLSYWLYGFWPQRPENLDELTLISQFLTLKGTVPSPENLAPVWQAPDLISMLPVFSGFLAMTVVAYILARFALEWTLSKLLRLRLTDSGVIRKLLSSAFAVTVVFIVAGKIGNNPMAMAVPLFLASIVLNFAVIVALSMRLWGMCSLAVTEWRRNANVRAAADLFGPRWRGLAHGSDEAIALMSAALLPAPSIRPQQRSSVTEKNTISGDDIIKPLLDQATWRTLTQYATGDDRDGLTSIRCSVTPYPEPFGSWVPSHKGYHRMTKEVEIGLDSGANESAQHLAVALRQRLQQLAYGRTLNASDTLMTDLSFGGLIHTSYLASRPTGEKAKPTSQDRIRQQIAEWIAASSITTPQPGLIRAIAAEPVPERELQEYVSVSRRRRATLRNRFRNLESVSVAGWTLAGAALALTLIVPAEIWIRPYTRATNHLTAMRAVFDEELTMRTTDAVAASSYAVMLAASGALDNETKIQDLLRSINHPNTRAAVAQRLAFAFGVANKPKLAEAVVSWARGPAIRQTSPYIERLIGLARLSAAYGQLVSPHVAIRGNPLPKEMARQAKAAWYEKQDRAGATQIMVFACEDSDKRAAAALYLPIRIAQALEDINAIGRFTDVAKEVREWGEELISRCMPENLSRSGEEHERHVDAWAVTLLVDVARDLHSWDRNDLASAALTVAGHLKERPSAPADSAPAAKTRESDALFYATTIAQILKTHDSNARDRCVRAAIVLASPEVLGYPIRSDKNLCETTITEARNPSEFCANKRKQFVCRLPPDCAKDPKRCSRFLENRRGIYDTIQDECRSDTMFVIGNMRARVRETFATCERHGAAAATAATASVLFLNLEQNIDAARRLIDMMSDADDKLETIAKSGLPSVSVKPELAQAFTASLMEELKWKRPEDSDEPKTRVMQRELLNIQLRVGIDREGTKDAARRIASILNDGTRPALKVNEALAGARALFAVPQAPEPFRVATDILQELILASGASAEGGSMESSLRRRVVRTSQWNEIEEAIHLLAHETAKVTSVEEMTRVVHKAHVQVNFLPAEFARRSGALGALHAKKRDFNRVLDVARATGFRSQMISAYCRILGDQLERRAKSAMLHLETEHDRFGLAQTRRWPLPVPVAFGKKPRFSFDTIVIPGPPLCWATQEYDIDS